MLQRCHKREPEGQDPIFTASFIRFILSNISSPRSVMVCRVLRCIKIIIFVQQTGCVVHAGVHQWECCWKMWGNSSHIPRTDNHSLADGSKFLFPESP